MANKETDDRIDKLDRRVADVEEKIRPKKARANGDPIVQIID